MYGLTFYPELNMNKWTLPFIVVFILVGTLWAGDSYIVVEKIPPDVSITRINRESTQKHPANKLTKIVRKGKSKIAIITTTVNSDGVTNVTSSYLVNNAIILTTVETGVGGKSMRLFLVNQATHGIEGFLKTPAGDILSLDKSEVEKFTTDSSKFY